MDIIYTLFISMSGTYIMIVGTAAEKIRVMKAQGTHLCCSIGFLTEKQALMLKEAGLDRINHNLNSSRLYH